MNTHAHINICTYTNVYEDAFIYEYTRIQGHEYEHKRQKYSYGCAQTHPLAQITQFMNSSFDSWAPCMTWVIHLIQSYFRFLML